MRSRQEAVARVDDGRRKHPCEALAVPSVEERDASPKKAATAPNAVYRWTSQATGWFVACAGRAGWLELASSRQYSFHLQSRQLRCKLREHSNPQRSVLFQSIGLPLDGAGRLRRWCTPGALPGLFLARPLRKTGCFCGFIAFSTTPVSDSGPRVRDPRRRRGGRLHDQANADSCGCSPSPSSCNRSNRAASRR